MLARLGSLGLVFGLLGTASGNVYRVRTVGDSGKYTLRWAIRRANVHAGNDRIRFAARLAGKTVYPLTPLPTITDGGTTINGDIDRDGAPDIGVNGRKLTRSLANGLTITADNCEIRGLCIGQFPRYGICLSGAEQCVIRSCHIGVSLAGTARRPNGKGGIMVLESDGALIGGTSSADRNVIYGGSSAQAYGIMLQMSSDCRVSGDYIGLQSDGTEFLDRTTGYGGIKLIGTVGCSRNVIGSATVGGGNVFGDLDRALVLNGASENTVAGNLFGLAADGDTVVRIEYGVMLFSGAHDNLIGGAKRGVWRNVFAAARDGVYISGANTANNSIEGNRFGTNALGTRPRPLSKCVTVTDGAGANVIGGSSALARNYFVPNWPTGNPRGVAFFSSGEGSVVQNNKFGYLPAMKGLWAHSYAIYVEGVAVTITDNAIARADSGVWAGEEGANPGVFRNTFRHCNWAVRLNANARCRLGDVGNRRIGDDGGNVFQNTTQFHVFNSTPYDTKAEGNDFGTTVQAEIEAKIHDKLDQAWCGRVDFIPLAGGVIPTDAPPAAPAITSATVVPTAAGAQITFALPSAAQVQARILNVAGRPMKVLCQAKDCEAGTNTLLWNATSENGLPVPNGTYLVEVTAKARDGNQARALGPVRVVR